MGIFNFSKKKPSPSVATSKNGLRDLKKEIGSLGNEHRKALASPDLSPATLDGHRRRYRYKDVTIHIVWQYGGQYGQDCASAGIHRGDIVQFLPSLESNSDPESVGVIWSGSHIGYMKANRMRSMVHQWKASGLPVLAVVSHVGGESNILLEVAFYGTP